MPSWLILILTVTVFFVAAWLLSERLSRGLTARRERHDQRAARSAPDPGERPSGW
ncbi:hypothetical protein KK137_03395 [Croceibacterium sp. LX-88]|uniref:Uncharacterized protein n=1 Tax=Croceibacterium selenioxidans TaxID=2838833 RepID=A0ABS5W0U3_9SPHN|nr:hypothetical protein [Croceibacterium selenioxidans]MBT2133371.1 hypothetical protein [Croceibacterium selenioxidans]